MDILSNVLIPTADQYFLMYFITGLYFAPDLQEERLRKSVLQRCAQCLPPYTSSQLAGSWMSMLEVESVYYYVLRKANESFIVKPPLLHQFFHGNLHIPGKDPTLAYPRFDDLFPPELHPRIQYGNEYDMVQNVVLINDPDISDMKPWDIERFKRLTGLEEFHLDQAGALLHSSLFGDILRNVTVQEEITSEARLHQGALQDFSVVPYTTDARAEGVALINNIASADHTEPRRLFLPSYPSREVWDNIVAATRTGYSVTGTAARGQVGPVLGLIDIGESEDSYLFRVSLPGVKRDEREFSCEVENDGKVLIRGVTTTGERTVCKYSHMFEMQSQNLCPSGHFSISFNLPGPVDPHRFTGNFGTDGILEGIVMKVGQC